ncbi:branched-chain amino acid ABC transporter permease [Paraburkholderia fungorum]|uniref:branched-chain amino acid ABC transporter permease n=1 Tax=Paraburkholderia fungorum TaxID=134537 RepID=UPI0038BA78FA
MDTGYLLHALVMALSSASILLIATLGLAVVFGLMGVVNLAHGEFIMIGAYCALFAFKAGLPFCIAVLVATLATALFGAVVERLIVRRLYGRLLDTMLATWGLSLVLYQLAVVLFGAVTPGIGLPMSNVSIGGYAVATYSLFLIGAAVLLFAASYLLLTRTGYGLMARAAIQDRATASALGIEVKRLNTATFALGAGLAGFAGAILLPSIPATPNMGFGFTVKAFLAVVVGGPVTLAGTLASAGGLGAASGLASSYWSGVVGDLLFFCATMAILRMFPKGISEHWRLKL